MYTTIESAYRSSCNFYILQAFFKYIYFKYICFFKYKYFKPFISRNLKDSTFYSDSEKKKKFTLLKKCTLKRLWLKIKINYVLTCLGAFYCFKINTFLYPSWPFSNKKIVFTLIDFSVLFTVETWIRDQW